MSTPNQLPWILSQWHAISSSAAPIKMDGVLFQDIKSVIDTMCNRGEVTTWSTHLTTLYNHLSDYDNPHEVTIDQLPVSVIEYLYQQWRKEGYIGDLQFFIKLIFTYIKVIQFAEMMEGDNIDSEILAPSVAAVTEYIAHHNASLEAHDRIFGTVFAGDHQHTWPTIALYQHLSAEEQLSEYPRSAYGMYMDIPAFGDPYYAGQKNTIVGCGRFRNTNGILFGINGGGSDIAYAVCYSWNTRTIQLKLRHLGVGNFHGFDAGTGMTPYNTRNFIDEEALSSGEFDQQVAEIDMRPYLEILDDPDYYVATALIIDRHRVKLAVRIQSDEYILPDLITRIANNEIPIRAKGPVCPRLFTSSMSVGAPLQSVAVYREAMTNLQLLALFDGYQFPIVKTA